MQHIHVDTPSLLVVPGDIHAPGQDDAALGLMTKTVECVAQDLALSREDIALCLTGDTFDSAGFSPHPGMRRKVRTGRATLDTEKRAMAPWFHTWRGIFSKVHVIAGNHEAWQESDLALSDSSWHDVYGELFDGDEVIAYPEGTRLVFGKLVVCHGHDLRGSLAANSAASVLREYPGQNTLYGHTHRLQSCTTPTYKYGEPVEHGAWTVGVMCRPDFEHTDRTMRKFADRHQQGFALVHFEQEYQGDADFQVELCSIRRSGASGLSTWAAGRKYTVGQ